MILGRFVEATGQHVHRPVEAVYASLLGTLSLGRTHETFQLANEYLHVDSLRCPAIFLYHFEIDWKRVDFLPAALPLMPIEKMQM